MYKYICSVCGTTQYSASKEKESEPCVVCESDRTDLVESAED